MHRLLNLIYYISHKKLASPIVTLDAERAYDKVKWKFLLLTTLHKSFIQWIKFLYTSPKATFLSNVLISQSFILHRGTRQGHPLSPSLFAIFVEPLAAAVRQNANINGIQTPNMEHKISLHADDILLVLQKPIDSIKETIH